MKKRMFTLTFLVLATMGLVFVLPAQTQNAQSSVPETVYEQAASGVVAINVVRTGPNELPQVGAGSGFVYDTQGHIITNHHVVEGATEIAVNFLDGTITRATVVGLDPDSDIAVLRVDVDPDKLQPLTFADMASVTIGEPVYAIGSPFGQRWTLTSGIVSATNRAISGLEAFSIGGAIQTDAAVNPGNSGGPLLDENAHVIGVNSQILSASGSNAGIGFAIPADLVQRVAQQLIDQGYVQYSYLGIAGSNMTLTVIEDLGLPNDTQGVVVGDVVAGGPASRTDLRPIRTLEQGSDLVVQSADILIAIDGQPLTSFEDLIGYLARNTQPGDSVTFTVLRAGQEGMRELDVTVRLTPRP